MVNVLLRKNDFNHNFIINLIIIFNFDTDQTYYN